MLLVRLEAFYELVLTRLRKLFATLVRQVIVSLIPSHFAALTLAVVPPPLNLDVEGFDDELGVSSL
jgi:hypothetical protein